MFILVFVLLICLPVLLNLIPLNVLIIVRAILLIVLLNITNVLLRHNVLIRSLYYSSSPSYYHYLYSSSSDSFYSSYPPKILVVFLILDIILHFLSLRFLLRRSVVALHASPYFEYVFSFEVL